MPINVGNPLCAASLSTFMSSSLPSSSTELRNPYDAIALLSHACMLAVGFDLIGLGEDDRIEARSDASKPSPLPATWNATANSTYSFCYSHPQSSLNYLLKISRLGSKAIVNGLGIGDDKVATFDIAIADYTSALSFPYNPPPSDQPEGESSASSKALNDLFITSGRLTDFAALVKTSIIQKLAPGIQKEGYEDSAHRASPSARQQREGYQPPLQDPYPPDNPYRPRDPEPARALPPHNDPLAMLPRRPQGPYPDFAPPDFEDEHQFNRPPHTLPGAGGGNRPLNIGERDLYPPGLGLHDPLRIGPGGIGGPGFRGGGGMHPTFDDPMFGGDEGFAGPSVGARAPPGARYDPLGPGDPMMGGPRMGRGGGSGGFGGGMGGGMGGMGHGGAGNPFGGFGGGDFI